MADFVQTRSDLETILAATDAVQYSGDELATIRHTANVLFNTMRGGVPALGCTVESSDVRAFIGQRSHATADGCSPYWISRKLVNLVPAGGQGDFVGLENFVTVLSQG